MFRNRRSIMVLLAVLVSLSLIVLPPMGSAADVQETAPDWEVLLEVVEYIQQYYLRNAEGESLWEGAVRGILETLNDPYSEYFDPAAYRSFMSNFESEFGGVGMRVQKVGDHITVVAPIEGTPAYEAGIQAGDHLVSVDGQDVVGFDLTTVVNMIRGEPGTTVRLEVLREGEQGPLAFELVRAVVEVPSLDYQLVEPGIGYLRLRNFSENSGSEVGRALEALRAEGARAFILDLRNNPGGLLSAAVEVGGKFLPSGPVVQVVGNDGEATSLNWQNDDPEGVVVVLINRGSASASEIVAGALQDRGHGVLVGATSFGKGTVQSLIPLSNGGALKLTTAEYLLPGGQGIHGKGLTPDIELHSGQTELATELLRAVLPLLDGSEELGVTFVAGQPVAIKEGGLVFASAPPFIAADGTFYVPVRALERLYDADLLWDPLTGNTKLVVEGETFVVTPGATTITANGNTGSIQLDRPVRVKDGRTYVPADFLKQLLGRMLRFDEQAGSLKVY